jgi:hypothetical protein
MFTFNQRPDFYSFYKGLQEKARGDIFRESEEQILGTDTNELAQYFFGSSRESVGINEGLPRSKDGFSQA